jgi:hypothetical protein
MVFIRESCGLVCIVIIYCCIIIVNISFLQVVIVPSLIVGLSNGHWVLLITYQAVILLVVWSHLKAMTT